jgi:membrane protease YdiL (CAAX protease family)
MKRPGEIAKQPSFTAGEGPALTVPLLPSLQLRTVPWGGFDVAVVVLLYFAIQIAAGQLVLASGIYERIYGSEAAALAANPSPPDPEAARLARLRAALWGDWIAFPLQAAMIPLVLWRMCGARPADLGLTTTHLGRNCLIGAAAAFVATPWLLGLHFLIVIFYRYYAGEAGTHEHAFEQLAKNGLHPGEWTSLILSAAAAAPVREEMLFRGAIQPWLAKHAWGGAVGMASALGVATVAVAWQAAADLPQGVGVVAADLAPVFFIAALIPAFLFVWRYSRSSSAAAIFGGAALFAAVHSGDWPNPIALFPLAVLLGALAYRTRSLVAPIVLHSLFNAVSCVLLFLQ